MENPNDIHNINQLTLFTSNLVTQQSRISGKILINCRIMMTNSTPSKNVSSSWVLYLQCIPPLMKLICPLSTKSYWTQPSNSYYAVGYLCQHHTIRGKNIKPSTSKK